MFGVWREEFRATICAMRQFANCTGTDRTTTTMMLTVSILALAVLLSEQAPKVFCGPTTNDTSAGTNHWGRLYGPATEDDRFYTLDYSHTTLRPRARASKTGWRREPRFISFETKDNSIEVEIDFAIPFLSIPIQKSMNGVMSSVLKGTPLLNVNLGAVAVAGVLTVGGALIGAAARTFSNSSSTLAWSSLLSLGAPRQASPVRAESKPMQKQEGANQRNEEDGENLLWTLLGSLDRTMEGYDIDTVACVQRTVCWYVKEATIAVAESKATTVETIVEGLSRADWIGQFISGTALEDAIQTARGVRTSCEKSFPNCAISSFVKHIMRLARKR